MYDEASRVVNDEEMSRLVLIGLIVCGYEVGRVMGAMTIDSAS